MMNEREESEQGSEREGFDGAHIVRFEQDMALLQIFDEALRRCGYGGK